MAMNPMQRKANNSFLLGIVITLLITGIIIGFLILQISKLNKEIDEAKAQTVQAYVVVDTIQSGITSMITEKYHNMFNKIYDSRFHDYIRDKNYETTMQSNTINRIYFGENIIEYLEWEKRYKDLKLICIYWRSNCSL